jgi:hypothetical protein
MLEGDRNGNSRRLLALTVAAMVLALALLAKYGHKPDTATIQILHHALTSPPGTDSTYYMQMGEDAFHGPTHSIYRELFFTQHQKFIYPPSSLFLLELLDQLPRIHIPRDAALFGLLLVSWIGILVVAVRLYVIVRGSLSIVDAGCIVVLGSLFLPIAEALYRGQIQILLTFLWGVAVLLWIRDKPGWAALVIALTCAFKPQLAIFLLWGVLRKQWRFTAVLAGSLGLIAICSIAHYGLRNNLDYFAVLSYLGRHGEALWANQSFNGLLNRLLRNGDPMSWSLTAYPPYRPVIYFVSTALSIIVLITALLLPRYAGWESTAGDFLFLGCSSVLISPIAWEHHYGYFLILVVYLLARANSFSLAKRLLISACTLALANRLPPLDHRMSGSISVISSYMLYAGIASLALLAIEQGSQGSLRLRNRST